MNFVRFIDKDNFCSSNMEIGGEDMLVFFSWTSFYRWHKNKIALIKYQLIEAAYINRVGSHKNQIIQDLFRLCGLSSLCTSIEMKQGC